MLTSKFSSIDISARRQIILNRGLSPLVEDQPPTVMVAPELSLSKEDAKNNRTSTLSYKIFF